MNLVHVHYYAVLREQRGLSRESLQTQASTPQELYHELKTRHGLGMNIDRLRVVVNDAFVDWQDKLSNGDTVVFIPPVAGG